LAKLLEEGKKFINKTSWTWGNISCT
jgi:hypothetical protein